MKDVNIALVIGHYKEKGGAYSPYLKSNEYDLYFDTLKQMNQQGLLKFKNKVFMHSDNRSYTVRQKEMSTLTRDYDLVIEFHFNAANEIANGCEVLHNSKNEVTKSLSNLFCELMEFEGFKNRGAKPIDFTDGKNARGEGFLKFSRPHAILLEPFFGDNEKDCDNFKAMGIDNFAKILNALVESFSNYVNK